MVDENGWQQHDPRTVTLDREIGWIVSACVSAGWALVAAVIWTASFPGGIASAVLALSWVLVTGGILALSYRWPAVEHRHARYRSTPETIEIERGVWWRRSIFVPRSRVQHLKVSRGPLERRHGLATLTIYTAGTQYSAVPLRGLADADAVRLRDELLPRTPATDGV